VSRGWEARLSLMLNTRYLAEYLIGSRHKQRPSEVQPRPPAAEANEASRDVGVGTRAALP
jgi:hypothetical protein